MLQDIGNDDPPQPLGIVWDARGEDYWSEDPKVLLDSPLAQQIKTAAEAIFGESEVEISTMNIEMKVAEFSGKNWYVQVHFGGNEGVAQFYHYDLLEFNMQGSLGFVCELCNEDTVKLILGILRSFPKDYDRIFALRTWHPPT